MILKLTNKKPTQGLVHKPAKIRTAKNMSKKSVRSLAHEPATNKSKGDKAVKIVHDRDEETAHD